MGNIADAGGTTTSMSKTPQAKDDWYYLLEDLITNSSIYNSITNTLTLDVMSNDLGGGGKSLFSIDDAEGNPITDLSKTDLLTNTNYSKWERTDDGNWIRIANGKIEFRLADPAHPNDFNYARDINSLSAGEVIDDQFTYAIQMGNGTLSWATVHLNITGSNDTATIIGTGSGDVVEASGAFNAIPGTPTASGDLDITDPDSGEAKFQPVAAASLQGTYGTFTFNADTGQWTYQLDNTRDATQALQVGDQVTDTLVVWSFDGSTSQTIGVTIAGRDDDPVITGQTSGSITEDAVPDTVSGNLDYTDVDDPDDVWTSAYGTTAHGSWSINAAGVWTFKLANENAQVQALNAGQFLVDSFSVTTAKGVSQTVVITINGANEPITAILLAPVSTTAEDENNFDRATGTLYTSVTGSALDGNNTLVGTGLANGTGGASKIGIHGGGGDDVLYGLGGADFIYGDAGADTIYGGSGKDTIEGGTENDLIYGGGNDDTILGEDGNDTIYGGVGLDLLTGGAGADQFFYTKSSDRGDLITDFSLAEGDLINLSGIDANATNGTGTNESFVWGGNSAAAYGLWYVYDSGSNVTHVYGDTDGNVSTAEFWFDLSGNVDLAAAQAAGNLVL
jgi:VCBS repeat-containing protein